MGYNLLLDTSFKNNNWKFINCKYENGYLISTNKVFGIEQDLILPDPTKLYFRINYKIENIEIKDVKIGIQTGKILHVDRKIPRINKNSIISVIDNVKQEKIKLHVIFESESEINKVYINNPILADLNLLNKSTLLKFTLNKLIKYREGYIYNNIYNYPEIKPDNPDFIQVINLENAKIGSIIKLKNKLELELSAKFIRNRYYLAKLDYEEINELGNIYFKYGTIISTKFEKEQCYILFRANDDTKLKLIIEPNDVLDYQINIKHIMIIDITTMKLLKADIPYLPFIGEQ